MNKILAIVIIIFIATNCFSQNKAIIFIGQSNCPGFNANLTNPTYSGIISNSYIYNGSEFVELNLSIDTSSQYPNKNGSFGVILPICYNLINHQQYDSVFVAMYGVNTAWLYDTNQVNFSKSNIYGQSFRNNLMETIANSTTILVNKKIDEVVLLIWQGESDARAVASANSYQSNLLEIIADVKLNSKIKIDDVVIIKIHSSLSVAFRPYTDTIRSIQEAICDGSRINTIVNIDDCEINITDLSHMTESGYICVGNKLTNLYLKHKSKRKIIIQRKN